MTASLFILNITDMRKNNIVKELFLYTWQISTLSVKDNYKIAGVKICCLNY